MVIRRVMTMCHIIFSLFVRQIDRALPKQPLDLGGFYAFYGYLFYRVLIYLDLFSSQDKQETLYVQICQSSRNLIQHNTPICQRFVTFFPFPLETY